MDTYDPLVEMEKMVLGIDNPAKPQDPCSSNEYVQQINNQNFVQNAAVENGKRKKKVRMSMIDIRKKNESSFFFLPFVLPFALSLDNFNE